MYLIELVYVPPDYLLCGGPETFWRKFFWIYVVVLPSPKKPDTNSTPLQPSQTPLQNETTTYPVLNRPTGQRGNNNVANAEKLHHFLEFRY
jgi:hypothetical protein